MSVFATVMIIGIGFNFVAGNIFSNSVQFLLVSAVAMACVGFSKEILFRGIVLRGARDSGYSESNVMLIVMLSFGLWHLANIIVSARNYINVEKSVNAK